MARAKSAPVKRRALKIRRDDEVIVIAGKDRGKTGKVLRVDPSKDKVYVEGLAIVKRHQRPLPNAPQREAGVIEREGPTSPTSCSSIPRTRSRPAWESPARVGHVIA
jgi:large subunit ribosomal protein L24